MMDRGRRSVTGGKTKGGEEGMKRRGRETEGDSGREIKRERSGGVGRHIPKF